jgi:hypothetical protein
MWTGLYGDSGAVFIVDMAGKVLQRRWHWQPRWDCGLVDRAPFTFWRVPNRVDSRALTLAEEAMLVATVALWGQALS